PFLSGTELVRITELHVVFRRKSHGAQGKSSDHGKGGKRGMQERLHEFSFRFANKGERNPALGERQHSMHQAMRYRGALSTTLPSSRASSSSVRRHLVGWE